MKKTIILIVFLLIAIIAVSGLYFSRLNQGHNATKQYLADIPSNASLLLSFNNDSLFYDLFKDYKGFEFILGKEEINELKTLKATFLENNNFIAATNQQPIYLSFHNEKDSLHWLLNIPLKSIDNFDLLKANFGSAATSKLIENGSISYFELSIPGVSKMAYASIQPDKALLSFSKSLIENSLDPESEHLSELFLEKFQENNRKNNSPLQLYINHSQLKGFLSILAKRQTGALPLFESLDGVSTLDLNYKSDVLMFSGTSSISLSDSSYLSLFLTQQPVPHQLKNWLPANVAEVATYGISDYTTFHNNLQKLLEKRDEIAQLREQIRYIEDENDVVIEDDLLSIWGNEFAKITLNSGERIGLIAIRDSLEYSLIADKISTVNSDSTSRQFDNSNLLYYALGDPFNDFKRPYFTYANGYLVIANTESELTVYLKSIKDEELLIKDENYILYNELQASSSNFTLFIHRENSNAAIEANLSTPFLKNYQNTDNFGFKKFYAFSLQLSGNDDQFITNLYGKFLPQ
jgi:hypothetical protein